MIVIGRCLDSAPPPPARREPESLLPVSAAARTTSACAERTDEPRIRPDRITALADEGQIPSEVRMPSLSTTKRVRAVIENVQLSKISPLARNGLDESRSLTDGRGPTVGRSYRHRSSFE